VASQIINLLLANLTLGLTVVNVRTGKYNKGKIARALGYFGYLALILACAAMALTSLILYTGKEDFLGRAGLVLQAIIAIDNFLNGNDPPSVRRRVWLKNKFAKLVPVRN